MTRILWLIYVIGDWIRRHVEKGPLARKSRRPRNGL